MKTAINAEQARELLRELCEFEFQISESTANSAEAIRLKQKALDFVNKTKSKIENESLMKYV